MPRQSKSMAKANWDLAVHRANAIKEEDSYENFLKDMQTCPLLANITTTDTVLYYLVLNHFILYVGKNVGNPSGNPESGYEVYCEYLKTGSVESGIRSIRDIKFQYVDITIYSVSSLSLTELGDFCKSRYYDPKTKTWYGDGLDSVNQPLYITADVLLSCSTYNPPTWFYIHTYTVNARQYESIVTVYNVWKWANNFFRNVDKAGGVTDYYPVLEPILDGPLYPAKVFAIQGGKDYLFFQEAIDSPQLPWRDGFKTVSDIYMVEGQVVDVNTYIMAKPMSPNVNYPVRILDIGFNMQLNQYVELTFIKTSETASEVEYQSGMLYNETLYRLEGEFLERQLYMEFKNAEILGGDYYGSWSSEIEANLSKNEMFDVYDKIRPNMTWDRLPGFTLNFDGGHSFWVPLGYAIDTIATQELHDYFPETSNMFMIIRRNVRQFAEVVFSALVSFSTRGASGVLETTNGADFVGFLYPYINSAAWGTYVHYRMPDLNWIGRQRNSMRNDAGGTPTNKYAPTTNVLSSDAYRGFRLHLVLGHIGLLNLDIYNWDLNETRHGAIFNQIGNSFPRPLAWTSMEITKSNLILSKYPDFNPQMENI